MPVAIAVTMALAVALIVAEDPLPAPITNVEGPIPADAIRLPEIPINDSWAQRVFYWGSSTVGPSDADYQNFSLSHWDMGLHFSGTFWIPIAYSQYLNLTNSSLHLDASGQYVLVPYDAYLGVHERRLFVYAVIHGVHWGAYNDLGQPNHSDPYSFALLIDEQNYQMRWRVYTQQYTPQELMVYPSANPYAPSLPLAPQTNNITSGNVPVAVDGQDVYANALVVALQNPLDNFEGAWNSPVPLTGLVDTAIVRSDSTIFLMGIPFSSLPHTSQDIVVRVMFWFAFYPPIQVTNGDWTFDFDPTPGYSGANGWNDMSAYITLYAPITGIQGA